MCIGNMNFKRVCVAIHIGDLGDLGDLERIRKIMDLIFRSGVKSK